MIYKSILGFAPVEIPAEALGTYIIRDAAVAGIKQLGGLDAPLTPEVNELRKVIRNSRRKIERNRWWGKAVPVKRGDCSQPMREIC